MRSEISHERRRAYVEYLSELRKNANLLNDSRDRLQAELDQALAEEISRTEKQKAKGVLGLKIWFLSMGAKSSAERADRLRLYIESEMPDGGRRAPPASWRGTAQAATFLAVTKAAHEAAAAEVVSLCDRWSLDYSNLGR